MTRRLGIPSGSPYEPVVGFSQALIAGDHVFVSGTAPVMPDGADPPTDPHGQARRCLEIIVEASRWRVEMEAEAISRQRCEREVRAGSRAEDVSETGDGQQSLTAHGESAKEDI